MYGDPARPLRPPKKRGVHRETFSDSERTTIIADGPEPDSLHRDRCALRLLVTYGLRKDSLRRVQFRHFDHNRRQLVIFAKGGKVRRLPIVETGFWDDLGRHIIEWEAKPDDFLLCRRQLRPNRHKLGERFVTEHRAEPMGVHGLHKWWYRCLERAGIVAAGQTSGRKMHMARHTAGQRVLDATGNLKAAQKLLGHSSITTRRDHASRHGRGRKVNRSRQPSRAPAVQADHAPGRNRTYDLALRRRALYPLSYRR
jgi:integrase